MNLIKNAVFWSIKNKMNKTIVLFVTLLSFLGSVYMLANKTVLAKMLPGKDSNTFNIYVDMPNGSSVAQTKQLTDALVKILQNEKEVLDVEVFLGMASPLDFAGLVKGSGLKEGEHLAEIVVNILKKHDRQEASFLMVKRLRPLLQARAKEINALANVKMVEPPAGPPVLAAIVAELYGANNEALGLLAKRIQTVFQQTEGLVDIDIMQDEVFQKYELEVDQIKIVKSGLSIKQVNQILYLAFEGMVVAPKNSEDSPEQINIFLRLKDASRDFNAKDLDAIRKKLASLKLMNNKGLLVSLSELVKVKQVMHNQSLYSKNLKPMLNVVAETDMVSQIYPLLEARSMMLKEFSKWYEVEPANLFNLYFTDKLTKERYKLVWDGELKVTLDTFRDLGGAFIAALVLIFLLMVVYYKSFALSGIVLLSSFLSIVGVIVGHWIMDVFTEHTYFLTATSLIGFIALIGISSRNALLLIDFTKELIEQGMQKHEAIANAAAIRSKPIFLTAAAIILASSLLASDAVFGGLGVALIFGTVAAVIASLLVVPVLIHNTSEHKLFKN